MSERIRVGIVGYGNVGRGAAQAVSINDDFELIGIFTRRDPNSDPNPLLISMDDMEQYVDKIDVMLMCGGSAADLPEQVPEVVKMFNAVDSFDTHAQIPAHFAKVDEVTKASGKLCVISTGWDPGLFSIMRVLSEAILPVGKTYTFWGKGVSQGHSDAIRQVEGVADARQYTVPIEETLESVRAGENKDYITRQMHLRDCYVVTEEGADLARIEKEIKEMPYYFADYDTRVTFMKKEDFDREHVSMPHGGFVIRSGETSNGTKQMMEFALKLDSNPEFTSSAMLCFARAVHHMSKEGKTGAMTAFDVPIGALSIHSSEKLRKDFL